MSTTTMRSSTRWRIGYGILALLDTTLAGIAHPSAHRLRRVTKPALMPTLGGVLLTDPRGVDSPLRASTAVGLAAGTAGDTFLLGSSQAAFLRGSAAFGVGHLAYIAGLWRGRGPLRSRPLAAVATVWAATAPVLAVAAGGQDRRLGPVVATYSGVLTGTLALSTQLRDPAPRQYSAWGAGLFLVSDAIIAVRTFVLREPPAWSNAVVMATYTAGQYLLTEGAVRASSLPAPNAAVDASRGA